MIDYTQTAPIFAQSLIGCGLFIADSHGKRGGIITETEAYTAQDMASHSFKGLTQRNAPMFMPPGTIYIYTIYGIHKCINIVCGNANGQAVLIRSIKPTVGIEFMVTRRTGSTEKNLCNGPAKLYQALDIPATLNGTDVRSGPLQIINKTKDYDITACKRIGITKATDLKWRFVIN